MPQPPPVAALASAPPAPRPRRRFDGPGFVTVIYFVAAGASVIASIVPIALATIIEAVSHGAQDRDALTKSAIAFWPVLLSIVFSQLAMLGVALLAWHFTRAPFRERLGIRNPGVSVLGGVIIVAGGFFPLLVGLILATLVATLLPDLGGNTPFTTLWAETPLAQAILWCAVIGIFPGAIEELLFRGVIQRGYLRRWSPVGSILLTSVLFGLLHGMPPAILFATVLGIWLGFVAWSTDSIALTACTHLVINSSFNVVMMVIYRVEFSESSLNTAFWILFAISVIPFIAAIVILRRRRPAPPWVPRVVHGAGTVFPS